MASVEGGVEEEEGFKLMLVGINKGARAGSESEMEGVVARGAIRHGV